MKPPYFGYFDLSLLKKKSTATTFEECLKEFDGDLQNFFPIEEFIESYHDEDNYDAFMNDAVFKFFYPEDEEYEVYTLLSYPSDKFSLRNGKEYCVHDYTDYIYPTDKDDETNIRLTDIIEEEFEHLSANYPNQFRKITIQQLEAIFDHPEDFDYPYEPAIICIKKVMDK
jgi:hypothetical protein